MPDDAPFTLDSPPPPLVAPPMSAAPGNDEQLINWKFWTSKPAISISSGAALAAFKLGWTDIRKAQVEFTVTIRKPTTKTTIEIRDGSSTLFSQEFTSGDYILQGDHGWSWDGYTNGNVLDTAKLRGAHLSARVVTDDGEDSTSFEDAKDGSLPLFVDATIDLNTKTIDLLVYVKVESSGVPFKSPTYTEFVDCVDLIKQGITRYWSRNSSAAPKRQITIGGVDYNVNTAAVEDKDRGVSFIVEHGLLNDRSCNYGVVLPGGAVHFDASGSDDLKRETAAHEFGHSVLVDKSGFYYSLTHKGTSTVGQDYVKTTDSAGTVTWVNPWPSAPDEIDVMKYYTSGGGPSDRFARTIATEDDVKALLACARFRF